jgi:uncharacterized protein YabE (DUF348 family)
MQAYTSPRQNEGLLGNSRLLYVGLGVVVAAVIILVGFFYNRHEIRILADGKENILIIRGGTIADAVKTAGVVLGEQDIVEPALKTAILDDTSVKITRMLKITVIADGKTTEHWTTIGTVEQTLSKLKIAVNPEDQILPELNNKIATGETIEVIRFSEKYLNKTIKVPFSTERQSDNTMERGTTRIVKQGQTGLIQKTIKITLRNGKEIKRELLAEKTVLKPVNKIVAFGTISVKAISRGGSIKFSRAIVMNASGYTHTGHNTASGIYPYRGAVAVDPRVIPMGTRLYIEGYGYGKALDIGSAIKGNKIDLFFDSVREARRWGRRPAKVYVID